jgi:hypothetical protein
VLLLKQSLNKLILYLMRRYVQAMGPFRDNSNYNDFYKFVLLFSPIMRNLKLEIF